MNTRRTLLALAGAIPLTLGWPLPAAMAQGFSTDKVTVVVPYSPGNGLDLLGREFADILSQQTGVPVIVDNREGAAGVIGTQYATRARPDGQTLLFTANPPYATSPFALEKMPYDPLTSLIPVARVGSVPLVLVTASKWQIHSIEQLREHLKKDPKAATYASAGVGSPGQIYGELLNQATNLKLQEVRYKATGQALTDVITGNVLVSLVSVPAAAQHLKAGTLSAIAVGSRQRLADMPSVPTLAEALGQKDFTAGVWYGFFAPPGTPADRVSGLFKEIEKAAASSRMQAFMQRQTMSAELLNPADFHKALERDVSTSRALVQSALAAQR